MALKDSLGVLSCQSINREFRRQFFAVRIACLHLDIAIRVRFLLAIASRDVKNFASSAETQGFPSPPKDPKGPFRTVFTTESDSVAFYYSVVNLLRIVIHYSKYSKSVHNVVIHYIFSSESLRVVNSLQIVNSLRVLFSVCRGPLGPSRTKNTTDSKFTIRSKVATAIVKHYGRHLETTIFSKEIKQQIATDSVKTTAVVKYYGIECRSILKLFSTEGSFGPSFLSFFLGGKKAGKNTKKQGFFIPTKPPKPLDKDRKTLQRTWT